MDWGEHFEKNFELIKRNKRLLLPFFLSHALILLIMLTYFHFTGLSIIYSDVAKIQRAYVSFLINSITGQSSQFELNIETSSAEVYSKIIDGVFSNGGLIMLFLVLLIIAIVLIYFHSLSLAMISSTVQNRKRKFGELLKITNKLFFKVAGLKIVQKLIYEILFIVMLLPTQLLWVTTKQITWIVFFIVLPFALFAMLYFGLRLMLVYPAASLRNLGVFQSIKESFKLTSKGGNHATYLFSIILGFLLIKILLLQPIIDLIVGIYASESTVFIVFSFLLLAVYVFLESLVIIFKELFTFPAYEEFE